jgi:hypothetical protein
MAIATPNASWSTVRLRRVDTAMAPAAASTATAETTTTALSNVSMATWAASSLPSS